jgi:hypothetical protein
MTTSTVSSHVLRSMNEVATMKDQDVKAQQGVAEAMRLVAAAEIEAPHLFADRRQPSLR